MPVAELKEQIIARVAEVDDEQKLELSLQALNQSNAAEFEFAEEDYRHFDEIEKEVEQGEYYTQEEFISIMKGHLDRYDAKHK